MSLGFRGLGFLKILGRIGFRDHRVHGGYKGLLGSLLWMVEGCLLFICV